MLRRNTSTTCNTATVVTCMGLYHGGGNGVPQNLEWGTVPQFCHIGDLQNTPKSVYGRRSTPGPAGGTYAAPPDLIVGWGWDTPPHTPHPTRHRPIVRRSPCVPQNSSQIYAYGNSSSSSSLYCCYCCCCCYVTPSNHVTKRSPFRLSL